MPPQAPLAMAANGGRGAGLSLHHVRTIRPDACRFHYRLFAEHTHASCCHAGAASQPQAAAAAGVRAAGQPGSSGSPLNILSLTAQIKRAETSQQVVRLVQQVGRLCNAFHFSAAVNRIAKLEQQEQSASNQAAYDALLDFAELHAAVLDHVAVVQTVYTGGVLQCRLTAEEQAAWQERLVWALRQPKLEPQHVSNGLSGWSKMGLPLRGQLVAAYEAAIQRMAEQMSSQNVANTLVAYANTRWPLDGTAAAHLLQRLEQLLPQANVQDVANSLWAAAKLRLQLSNSLKAAFSKAMWRIIPTATSQALANISLACGTLRWSPGGSILAAAVAAMLQLVAAGAVDSQALRNFLWGLAELQEQGVKLPGELHALLSAAAGWAGSRWAQLSALGVVDLCYNLARLGHQPSTGWIAAAVARCDCACAGHAARRCDIQSRV